jgi:hypothetical protein
MECSVILSAEWKVYVRDIPTAPEMVIFQLFRTATKTLFRAFRAVLERLLRRHAAPPESDR